MNNVYLFWIKGAEVMWFTDFYKCLNYDAYGWFLSKRKIPHQTIDETGSVRELIY